MPARGIITMLLWPSKPRDDGRVRHVIMPSDERSGFQRVVMDDGQKPADPPKLPVKGDYGLDADDEPGDPTLKTWTHVPRVLIIEDTVELGEVIQATLQRMHLM